MTAPQADHALRAARVRHALRAAAAIVVLCVTATTASACMDRTPYVGDRLSGEMVVATNDNAARGATGEVSAGPTVEVPESMSGSVLAAPYRENGKTGTRLSYDQLPLGQFNQLGDLLTEAYPNSSVSMELTTKRSGDVVRLRGNADLTGLTDGTDVVSLTVRFAGPISATNGKQTADDTVEWSPTAGRTSDLTAEADYADPGTAAFGDWTWLLVGITLAVVIAVGVLAYVARDTSPRVGTPSARG